MKLLLKKSRWSLSAIVLGGMSIIVALIMFKLGVTTSTEQFIHKNMEEMNKTAISSMNYSFKTFIDMLEQQSKMINLISNTTDDEIMTALKTFSADKRFARVTLITTDGKAYSSQYGIVTISDMTVISNMDKNYTTMTDPRITEQGELVIDIGTPAYLSGEKVGRLVATIGSAELKELYISNSLQGDAGLTLVTSTGMVITTVSKRKMVAEVKDDFFEFFQDKEVEFIKNTPAGMTEDIKNNQCGWLKCRKDGHSLCVNYQPFGVNGWYMIVSGTDKTLDMQVLNIRRYALFLTSIVLLVSCGVAAVIIIQRGKEQERMNALKSTYNIAIRKTNDLFYEVDIDRDQFVDYSESSEKAVWKKAPTKYSKALSQVAEACTPEFKKQFLETFTPESVKSKIKEGVSYIHLEYKIVTDKEVFRWLSVTAVPVADYTTNATKLICMEKDITEQKLHHERLHRFATQDGLTELYNKVTVQSRIDYFLQKEGKEGKHALIMIDIDHFKAVNDTLGHAKGDEVISKCSDILRRIFDKEDIVGRIGGDEFVVLLKDYNTLERVCKKAQEICDGFRKTYTMSENPDKTARISASVGISLYNQDGQNFDELYKSADTELYTVKENGRDHYSYKNIVE
ncbi:MAG: sensor domain-containing diguanylate cyclase [Lachnospiraceae bacterium]